MTPEQNKVVENVCEQFNKSVIYTKLFDRVWAEYQEFWRPKDVGDRLEGPLNE